MGATEVRCDGNPKARGDGNVRILAHFFETLATSSPDTRKDSEKVINNPKGFAGSGTLKSDISQDKTELVPCNECLLLHPSHTPCPPDDSPCNICYNKTHDTTDCPYLDSLPRGVKYNPGYEIVCECGNAFNEDRWACTYCGGSTPKLEIKVCSICYGRLHATYECPTDKVRAARRKSIRDMIHSRVAFPCKPVSTSNLSFHLSQYGTGKGTDVVSESSSGLTYS